MAHFAKLDADGFVLEVNVVHDNEAPTEEAGIAFLVAWSGGWPYWKQTSYNTVGGQHTKGGQPFRKNFAGKGFRYDASLDAFIPPKPYPSWVLNTATGNWDAPEPVPNGHGRYVWDEAALSWVEVTSRATGKE